MVIIDIKYKKKLDVVDQFRNEHIEYLSRFYEQGLIIASGPYNNRSGGLIISIMDSKSAYTYMKNDPFYIHDIGDFQIKEFEPTKITNDFNKLINDMR